ncbi:hypothetical protein KSF_033410 [Reticulibacter mediterranei]|uniref:Uncharacterized protein n=1 Tax=Reticulibacter mediterranei TaxID=2778369 RepID=A0A8J3N2A1_9CHLR|nr:hypothetical protein [Reticulibacter mediterranei]GHO93293.1 hypothetical protein KSF_033410 [Reticulibacter mediterranei]
MAHCITGRTLKTHFGARPPTTYKAFIIFYFKDGTKNYWMYGRWLSNSS